MDAIRIRKDFHQLIDNINDIELLQEFYKIISDYSQRNEEIDILDELTDEQRLQLKESWNNIKMEKQLKIIRLKPILKDNNYKTKLSVLQCR